MLVLKRLLFLSLAAVLLAPAVVRLHQAAVLLAPAVVRLRPFLLLRQLPVRRPALRHRLVEA